MYQNYHFDVDVVTQKKGIPKKKKTYEKRNDTFGPLPPFGLCPNYSHDDNFFPHLYLINTCTYIEDMYLKLLIQLILSIMPSWSKNISKNTYTTYFFHYAFMVKINKTCCPPCGNTLEKNEEKSPKRRKKWERGWDKI